MNTKFERIFGRLKKLRQHAKGWSACCPAHDDRRPSLELWISRHDGVLMARCRSRNCRFVDIARSIGTRACDWYPGENWSREKMPDRKIVNIYPYHDERGELLYQNIRYDPKDFSLRRPDGNGGWIWNLDGVDRILYRLPELLKEKEQPVFIVEGEAKVDLLRSLELTATTSGNATSWRHEMGAYLRQRRVAILPDNDDAGERYCVQVVGSLLVHGVSSVRIVRLPGLGDSGDVVDFFANALTYQTTEMKKKSLLAFVRATPEYTLRTKRILNILLYGNIRWTTILY